MPTDSEQIRREIEQTRRELSRDVDTLTEKVSPSAVMQRQVDRTKGKLYGVKDKVMGAVPDGKPSDGLHAAEDKVTSAAVGNPLAAGVIAFGAGWLLSTLIPASGREEQMATAARGKMQEHSEALTAPLAEAAQATKEHLQEHAQEAVAAVKGTATDAAAEVKDAAGSAKQKVT